MLRYVRALLFGNKKSREQDQKDWLEASVKWRETYQISEQAIRRLRLLWVEYGPGAAHKAAHIAQKEILLCVRCISRASDSAPQWGTGPFPRRKNQGARQESRQQRWVR